jgi:ornithine decarboxylase
MAESSRAISAPSMKLVTPVVRRSSVKMIPGGSTPMMVFSEGCESTAAFFGGPICDMIDGFRDHENLPKLSLGDVIVIPEIGAFSIATANNFSGNIPPSIIDLEDTPETPRSLP